VDGPDSDARETLGAARKAAADLLLETARFAERVLGEIEQARGDVLKATTEAAELLRQTRELTGTAGRLSPAAAGPPAPVDPGGLHLPTLEQAVREYRQRPTVGTAPHRASGADPPRSAATSGPPLGTERCWWWLNSPG
jgi:hypothetical protein